jgi:cysteine-rich repeat protein
MAIASFACARSPDAGGFRCGNGRVEAGEQCDEGPANGEPTAGRCRFDCTAPRCGDGIVDTGEGCDDGEGNSDVWRGACRTTCVPASCGDGVVDPGEECDDGADNEDTAAEACRTWCRWPSCGDGVRDAGEACDDGPANSDTAPDSCRTNCRAAGCGDGAIDTGEECDDGARNADDVASACRSGCRLPICGDGVIDLGEECDDADPHGDDGCTRQCALNLPATCFADGLPVLDVRSVGVPEGTGYRVDAFLESGRRRSSGIECELDGKEALYAFPIPAAGDLVVELEMPASQVTRARLAVGRSCTNVIACLDDLDWTGSLRHVVEGVSPADGVYFFLVDQRGGDSRTYYTLHVYVRPALAAGDPCAVDGSLGPCGTGRHPGVCLDGDGDGLGECTDRLREGAVFSTDPVDPCLAPLSCRGGRCGPSCGDGIRQEWEACDDGNAVEDDNCGTTCEPRVWTCADPFDLNLAWDPATQGAVWYDELDRSVDTFAGPCNAGSAPDLMASFVAPTAGRYHFRAAAHDEYVVLGVLRSCDPADLWSCGSFDWATSTTSAGVFLAAGQAISLVVDGGSQWAEDRVGEFALSAVLEACGDGVVQGGEECDDGNDRSDDRCLPDCTVAGETCASPYRLPPLDSTGIVEWTESWSPYTRDLPAPSCAGSVPSDAVAAFTPPRTGRYSFQTRGARYLVVRSETCSGADELGCVSRWIEVQAVEADLVAGETVWIAIGRPGAPSDGTEWPEEFTLRIAPVVCGDGIRAYPEECDDGNTEAGDGCDPNCRIAPLAEVEPNDVRAEAQYVPPGSRIAGSLPPEDIDFVSFDLAAGIPVTLTTYLGESGGCPAVGAGSLVLDLYGPTGDWIGTARACEPLSFAPVTGGRHFVRLDDDEERGIAAYLLDIGAP